MSYENALKTVDFLLEVLNEADKPAPADDKPATKAAPKTTESDVKEEYFTSVEDDGVTEGKTVQVTKVLKKLEAEWLEAELGLNDDKGMYLGAVGKIVEIEEDDDTVQLRWENYDTCWIPVKACVDAKGAKETLPVFLSHLGRK
mmetsp:Transcript_19649/g.17404  ORF Transcript_19649/g.17404 Transcript_19649/m.17404 type:complete len:144 (+) Transcript_19649:115-546(+)|eukprot:CAMPEP_0201578240 /NCGR_PEP_ID=MMETSP0190_2-20130828/25025_1 /ASSEMBLY_ACC=CAM_ASM_000263 /TAXON_ID=37353 /ORGANISM="Rosalina sp." /LENGTH=143 /DNA_ID=CAMNT_0048011203 /DNA_START=113 /DNA_END=544 /DNA_ORIENTATION=-